MGNFTVKALIYRGVGVSPDPDGRDAIGVNLRFLPGCQETADPAEGARIRPLGGDPQTPCQGTAASPDTPSRSGLGWVAEVASH